MELTALRGVGPARLSQLGRLQLHTVEDLLYHFPRRYQNFTKRVLLSDLIPGEEATVLAEVVTVRARRIPGGRVIVQAVLQDDSGRGQAAWFNQAYVQQALREGERYLFQGKADGKRRLQHPYFEPVGEEETPPSLLPVYALTAGLSQKVLRGLVRQALQLRDGPAADPLPRPLRARHGLPEYNFALENIHFPESEAALEWARHRLAFEEMLLFQMALALRRRERRRGFAFAGEEALLQPFRAALPFPLTGAQERALADIRADMAKPEAMNRIVQGDVGSGKTVLALAALYLAFRNGKQGVLMAPTEVLARQHYEEAQRLLEPLGVRVGLLVGSLTPKQKREAQRAARAGEWQVVVGTQALIQAGVAYADLGLVVADEQHRFGVRQRSLLSEKGNAPDCLLMSATPIPRTLSLVIYGDLDVSVVDELPPGRQPVMTRRVPERRRQDMYGFLRDQAAQGSQAYVICPRVEEDEETECASVVSHCQALAKALPGLRVDFVHGKLSATEKDGRLEAFRSGTTDVLVSTTVVEVGVNVPNATTMVIENADRFGLAQLHQLRGRVGRGAKASYCFLMSDADSEEARERLETMVRTADGFALAQKDLETRGPGDWLGTRQHGLPQFRCADLFNDMAWLLEAKQEVECLLRDPELKEERRQVVGLAKDYMARRMEESILN